MPRIKIAQSSFFRQGKPLAALLRFLLLAHRTSLAGLFVATPFVLHRLFTQMVNASRWRQNVYEGSTSCGLFPARLIDGAC
jgi:hypothetical protein